MDRPCCRSMPQIPIRAGVRPRLLAGRRGRRGVARRLRRARRGFDRAQSTRDVVAAIADQAARLLFYSTAVPHAASRAARGGARRPLPRRRWARCSSATPARRPTRTRSAWRARRPGGSASSSVRGGWHGRTVATLACTDGATLRGGRAAGRHAALPARCRSTTWPRSRPRSTTSMAALIVEPVQGMAGARDCTPRVPRGGAAALHRRGRAPLRRGAVRRRAAAAPSPRRRATASCRMRSPWPRGSRSGSRSGLLVAGPMLAEGVAVGDLGSTFGGGPVACAAALANLAVIERGRPGRERHAGRRSHRAWAPARSARGGCRAAACCSGSTSTARRQSVQQALFGRRILTGTSSDPEILRLMPPLTLSIQEADLLLAGLREVLA